MYLGIDQSLRSTGVAVVSAGKESLLLGTVAPKKLTGAPRLAYIRDGIQDAIRSNPGIKYAALEGYSIDSVNRPFDLGEVGGLVRLSLHDAGIPFIVVSPKQLKQFVTGTGNAKKEDMRLAVLQKWHQDIDQDDACDAFGLAHVARAFHLHAGATRPELEVLKKLRDPDKKLSLVSYTANVVST